MRPTADGFGVLASIFLFWDQYSCAGHGFSKAPRRSMDRYGICGKMLAKEGQRDALLEILIEASRTPMTGCVVYIVCKSPTEANAIWVMEVWQTEADHEASFKLDSVKALITKALPVMAGATESIRMVPVGGKGLGPA